MSPFFIALTLTDILLLALIVALPLRVAWWAKVAAIVVVLALNFAAWGAGSSGRGWAVEAPLPEHAEFAACVVIESDVIYVWEIPLDYNHGVLSYHPSVGEPRAYREPYDRSLHEACVSAEKAKHQGQSVGIRKRKDRAGHGPPGKYHPYVLPSIHLPQKEGS